MKRTVSAVSFFLAALALTANAEGADNPFDGKWKISITYSTLASSSSVCRGGLGDDPLVVTGGKLSGLLNHTDWGTVAVEGSLAADGTLQEAAASGDDNYVTLRGRLGDNNGGGTWKESKFVRCFGTWKAKRVN